MITLQRKIYRLAPWSKYVSLILYLIVSILILIGLFMLIFGTNPSRVFVPFALILVVGIFSVYRDGIPLLFSVYYEVIVFTDNKQLQCRNVFRKVSVNLDQIDTIDLKPNLKKGWATYGYGAIILKDGKSILLFIGKKQNLKLKNDIETNLNKS